MHQVIHKLMGAARAGVVNSQVEFGTLTSLRPMVIQLDDDPSPLKEEEKDIVVLKDMEITEKHIGSKFALISCTNGQYLILGEVV